MTALSGSSALGIVFSTVVGLWRSSQDSKLELYEILRGEKRELNEHALKYQKQAASSGNSHSITFFMLAATYCLCTLICFLCGDVPVASQGFNVEPSSWSLAFGLFERSVTDKTVYLLTFAGLGVYFMSPLSFILTVRLTGIASKR
jgi:hypothetical protein